MDKTWSNTVLVAYSSIPKMLQEINIGVSSRVRSSYRGAHLRNGISNERLVGEILKLNGEKRKLMLLRQHMNEAFGRLSPDALQILKLRYAAKRTMRETAAELGISLRTAFRRLLMAETIFAHELYKEGYDEARLEKEFIDDKFISKIHERIMSESYSIAKHF